MLKTIDMELLAQRVRRLAAIMPDETFHRLRVCTPATDWHQPNGEELERLHCLSADDITSMYDRLRVYESDDTRSLSAHISLIVVLRGMFVELPYVKLGDFLTDSIPVTQNMIDQAEKELERQLPQDAGWVDMQAILEAALG